MQEASIEFYWSRRESIWHQLGDFTSCRIHVLRLTILADIRHCLTGSNSPRISNDIIILQLICKLSSSVYVQEWTSMHVHAMKGSQNACMYVHNLYRDSAPIQPQAYRIDYYNYADLDLHVIWIPEFVQFFRASWLHGIALAIALITLAIKCHASPSIIDGTRYCLQHVAIKFPLTNPAL